MQSVLTEKCSPLGPEHGFNPVMLSRLQCVSRACKELYGEDRFWQPYRPDRDLVAGDGDVHIAKRARRTVREQFLAHVGALQGRGAWEVMHLYGGSKVTWYGGHYIHSGDGSRATEAFPDQWVVAQAAVHQFGHTFKNLSERLRGSIFLAWEAVTSSSRAYEHVCGPASLDVALAKYAVRAYPPLRAHLAAPLAAHLGILLAAATQEGASLKDFSPEMKDYEVVVLAAVEEDGLALQFASERMQARERVVLAAVRQNGCALRYAHSVLRARAEVAMAAVQNHAWALRDAAPHLQERLDIVCAAVRTHPSAVAFAGPKVLENASFQRLVCSHPQVRLNMLPGAWLDDPALVALSLPRCRADLWLVSDEVQAHPSVAAKLQ